MKKHEAFQFLVKRRAANNERKLTRKETLSGKETSSSASGASVKESVVEPLDLSSVVNNDKDDLSSTSQSLTSPAAKRRGERWLFYNSLISVLDRIINSTAGGSRHSSSHSCDVTKLFSRIQLIKQEDREDQEEIQSQILIFYSSSKYNIFNCF